MTSGHGSKRKKWRRRLSPLLSSDIPITARNEKNDLRLEQWNRGVRDERAARCVYLSCPLRHSNPAPPPFPSPSSSSSRFSSLVPSKFILLEFLLPGPFGRPPLPFSPLRLLHRSPKGGWLALLLLTGFSFHRPSLLGRSHPRRGLFRPRRREHYAPIVASRFCSRV